MAADIVIFDPATVKCGHEEVVHDFPDGGWRIKEPAEGVYATIVNGQVLLEEGKHTGALPGRVLRNTYYHANHGVDPHRATLRSAPSPALRRGASNDSKPLSRIAEGRASARAGG